MKHKNKEEQLKNLIDEKSIKELEISIIDLEIAKIEEELDAEKKQVCLYLSRKADKRLSEISSGSRSEFIENLIANYKL